MSEELKNAEVIDAMEETAVEETGKTEDYYIQLGEAKLQFGYTVNALCEVERVLGMPIELAIKSGAVTTVRALFWGGLISCQPNLSLADVGAMMQSEIGNGMGENRATMNDFAALCLERMKEDGLIQ